MVPVARSEGSCASSFMDRIGPHGISCSFRMSMASNFVLVMVHFSIVSNTCFRRGRRALGVAKSGSVAHCSLPMTLQISFHTGAWQMKYRYALGSVSQPLHLRMD